MSPTIHYPIFRTTAIDPGNEQIHEDLAGIKVFFVALESEKEKAFLEPENLRKLSQIQAFMAKQAVFDTSVSVADHLKYVNREFQGGLSEGSLPPTRQLVAQYLLFFSSQRT